MEIYGAYLWELFGAELIYREYGFIAFRVFPEEVFIRDFYVEKSSRGLGLGDSLIREVYERGREAGCKWITCNIALGTSVAEQNIQRALSYGWKVIGGSSIAVSLRGEL